MLLALHVLAGIISLCTGISCLIFRKGASAHKRAGMIYSAAMVMLLATGFALAITRNNLFLLLVSLFTSYMFFTGFFAAADKKRRGRAPYGFILLGCFAAAHMVMIAYGSLYASEPAFGFLCVVFGFIGIFYNVNHFRYLAGKGGGFLPVHLGGMIGSLIAVSTAFASVNIRGLPFFVIWLGPTVLLTPVIVWWNIRLNNKGKEVMNG